MGQGEPGWGWDNLRWGWGADGCQISLEAHLIGAGGTTPLIAIAAIDGPVAPRLKGDFRVGAAFCTDDGVHLPLAKPSIALLRSLGTTGLPARGASLGVGITPLNMVALVIASEFERLSTLRTGQVSILENHW